MKTRDEVIRDNTLNMGAFEAGDINDLLLVLEDEYHPVFGFNAMVWVNEFNISKRVNYLTADGRDYALYVFRRGVLTEVELSQPWEDLQGQRYAFYYTKDDQRDVVAIRHFEDF